MDEGRLKGYRNKQFNQNSTSKMTKENSTKKSENLCGQTNNRMQMKQNDIGVEYANGKYIAERPNG